MARDTSGLVATQEKHRSYWRCEVPGYVIEVFEKALANPLISFGCYSKRIELQLNHMKQAHALRIAKHPNKR